MKRSPRPWLLALLVAGACTPAAEATDGSAGASGETGGETGTTGDVLPPAPEASAACDPAPIVGPGRYYGTLRGVAPGAGICGVGGPTTFLRLAPDLDVDVSVAVLAAGFGARLEIAPEGCVAGRALACGEAGALSLSDVGAGSSLVLAIGAAAGDPGLGALNPAEGEPDPLAFAVDVDFHRVLGLGERCLPESRGRCPGGTICAAPEGVEPADEGAWVCVGVAADTCATAEPLALAGAAGEIVVDAGLPQTDAHSGPCGGAGTRERVLRLSLEGEVPPAAQLILASGSPDIGLAARAPGCALADAVACAPPGIGGAMLVIDDVDRLADIFLFVELGDEVVDPQVLTWSLVGG